jgi:hypothetical protein
VALPPEFVFSQGKMSSQLALQVSVCPAAAERAPDPPCPLAKPRHAGSSKSECMTDTI